ncbi:BsuPI-related putative proteinase inhibitor [Natronosalvus caseinilyticus]|uniref:BsuPI-related putative proteinase inhibitor n=1 Tax=Natronosalvus caseinilyticus TaxID=2953747 RepID=UPI0028A5DEE4|nr:BsuPI-related putative proteinase inhibitor [Natronosalvus caseinilyticus]
MTLEGTLDVTVTDGVPTFELTVANTGPDDVTLQFRNGCKADFAVEDGGAERWRLTNTRMFTQVLSQADLDAGETTTFEATGDQLEPGQYVAVGELNANNYDCTARAEFAV